MPQRAAETGGPLGLREKKRKSIPEPGSSVPALLRDKRSISDEDKTNLKIHLKVYLKEGRLYW